MKRSGPTFSTIIARWPTTKAYADEIGVAHVTARSWKRRNSIPAPYWAGTVDAAQKRGYQEVTLRVLAELASA